MQPKPKHLGPEYASVFGDTSVVRAYTHRPPYPSRAIARLASLTPGPSAVVLDVGCGSGDLAIPLSHFVGQIDAVDISTRMIARARERSTGIHNITWIEAATEQTDLHGPYDLITAGESLHWMEWAVVLPRFARLLSPAGVLAVIERNWEGPPALTDRVVFLIMKYATNREYRPYDLIEELQSRDLFHPLGQFRSNPVPWNPTIEEYLECRHSQNGLSRERMGSDAEAFDTAVRDVLEEMVHTGVIKRSGERLHLSVRATVVWGKPTHPRHR
ncbi:MAG: class I SAM-dependent methyltransferase [Chloroflexota bacterium]